MLPIVKQPKYKEKIDMYGNVEYRPMLNHEYKALATAIEVGDDEAIALTMLDIVKNCTNDKISASKCPAYVIEYMFMRIFTKSVENKITATYTCGSTVVDEEGAEKICGQAFNIVIPIEKAEIKYTETHEKYKTVQVDSNISIKLRNHTFDETLLIEMLTNNVVGDDMIVGKTLDERVKLNQITKEEIDIVFTYYGIVEIITPQGVITRESFSLEDYKQWYNNLPVQTISDITLFYSETPSLYYEQPIKCIKCGSVHVQTYKGLNSFFS